MLRTKSKIQALVFCTILLLAPLSVWAQALDTASLSVSTSASSVKPGALVTVSVLLATSKAVNAFDLELIYPSTKIQPVSLNDNGSVVDLWQTKDWSGTPGKVSLVGGMGAPFVGTRGKIADLTFKALVAGSASISFGDTNVYYADGDGTAADTTLNGSTITIGTPSVVIPEVVVTPTKTVTPEVVAPAVTTVPKKVVTPVTKKTASSTPVTTPSLTKVPPPVKPTGASGPSVSPPTQVLPEPDALVIDTTPKDTTQPLTYTTTDAEYQIRTMRLLTYSEWNNVDTFEPVPRGVWKYQIIKKENGQVLTESFYVATEIEKRGGGAVLGILFVLWVFRFIINQWTFSKQKSSLPLEQ